MNFRLLLVLALLPAAAPAAPRSSASYTIATDTADAGGKRATSAAYTNDGSAGGVAGLSTVTAPAETTKSGYLGQLYDITGLTLTAVSLNVNESATDQLGAWQALDDATFLAVPAASVVWSVASGPLTGISAAGLATAGTVYQDTAATAQGVFSGNTGTLGLTVKNVNPDDFGNYAGDGLDDAWQNQYFGLNNPNAAPAADPDGDGQTNLFEFTAGLVPTDPQSRFLLNIAPVVGQPAQKKLIFSPRLIDRTYTIKARTSLLTGSYLPLTNPAAPTDNGQERTITDLSATGVMKFYRVEITKP
jgi:hypothetical protein